MSFQCLKNLSQDANQELLLSFSDLVDAKDLIYCCLILIKYSSLQCKPDLRRKLSKQPIIKLQSYFCLIIAMFSSKRTREIFGIVMDFMREENIWKYEPVSIVIIQSLLISCECAEAIFYKILDRIEEMVIAKRINHAQCCTRILYSIINYDFKEMPGDALIRLMTFYHMTVGNQQFDSLRTGLKMSLLRLFAVINNQEIIEVLHKILNLTFSKKSAMALKEFGCAMKQGIAVLSKNEISENLKSEIVGQLLWTMTSGCKIESNFACNFLTSLIDHYQNLRQFQEPIIFYLKTTYGVALGDEKDAAIPIILKITKQLERAILTIIEKHGDNHESLSSIYKLICVIIVSLPSGPILVMVMKVLMKLQAFAIEQRLRLQPSHFNSIHALIISVMTLICYVSQAKSLSTYIHQIVCIRYDTAAHLNPPIKKVKGMQVTESIKPEIFLDKWELRYCLWMHYKLGEILELDGLNSKFSKQ